MPIPPEDTDLSKQIDLAQQIALQEEKERAVAQLMYEAAYMALMHKKRTEYILAVVQAPSLEDVGRVMQASKTPISHQEVVDFQKLQPGGYTP